MTLLRVKNFVKRELANPEHPAESFNLYHEVSKDERTKLSAVNGRKADLDLVSAEIAACIWEQTESRADCFEGKQIFLVESLDAKGDAKNSVSFAIGVNGFKQDVGEPNEKGFFQMCMRTIVQQNEMILSMTDRVLRPLADENKRLTERSDRVEANQIEVFSLLEELTTVKQKNEIELLKTAAGLDVKAKAWAELQKYAPMLLTAFMGDKKKPEQLKEGDTASTPPQAPANNVGKYQATLRNAFKLIDRQPVYDCLGEDDKQTLDNLLGLGSDPESPKNYRDSLQTLWNKLPEEVSGALMVKLGTNLELAVELQEMLAETAEETPKEVKPA